MGSFLAKTRVSSVLSGQFSGKKQGAVLICVGSFLAQNKGQFCSEWAVFWPKTRVSSVLSRQFSSQIQGSVLFCVGSSLAKNKGQLCCVLMMRGVGIWTVHGVEIWTVRDVYLQYCRHQNLLMVEQLWEQEDNPSEMAYTKIIRSYGEDVSHLSPTFFLSVHSCTVRQYT